MNATTVDIAKVVVCIQEARDAVKLYVASREVVASAPMYADYLREEYNGQTAVITIEEYLTQEIMRMTETNLVRAVILAYTHQTRIRCSFRFETDDWVAVVREIEKALNPLLEVIN